MNSYDESIIDRRTALAKYLELPFNDVIYNPDEDIYGEGMCFFTEDGTYFVLDEDEALRAVAADVENTIDDIGLEAFNEGFRDWIIENAISDSEYFEDYCREDYQAYAEDIEGESDDVTGNRLLTECVEAGIISGFDVVDGEYFGDEDTYELAEQLADHIVEQIRDEYNGDFYHWFVNNFGSDAVKSHVTSGYLSFDYETIAQELIDTDGYGPTLARWDGIEHDIGDGYYAFKDDDYDRRDEVTE